MPERAALRKLRQKVKTDALTLTGGQLKMKKNRKHKNKMKNK